MPLLATGDSQGDLACLLSQAISPYQTCKLLVTTVSSACNHTICFAVQVESDLLHSTGSIACNRHNAWSQDGMQCIPLHQGCCQPGRCPADGLTGLWGLTVKAQCLSACLPPRHPISLWLSYQPRVVGIGFSQTRRVVLYKLGSKPVQAVCKGESGALN